MNDQPSPAARLEGDTPPSPKRKKVRAKYAPKACVSCRRSKLKCSGENPCQRCLDNGKRCFYSEDQTAAEALQNLSRPAPVQPPLATLGTTGNGIAPRSILPRHESIERRASDASVLGLTMQARLARIEGMMETLVQERGMTVTPRGSMERDEAVSDSMQGDFAVQITGETFNPNLSHVRQTSFKVESPERIRHSLSGGSPSSNSDSAVIIRVGCKSFAFPSPVDYQKYLDFFFADLSTYCPCVNEADFRIRSEGMLATRAVQANDVCFLALHYIIFACSDIAVDTSAGVDSKAPGWQWFQVANELLGKRALSGQGDLSLIQCLILEATYLTSADNPNAAYNVIGAACRLCFQFGLHQQSSWRSYTPFEIHMRQRIFWTLCFLDRSISLSCGRPYCIREADIDVEQPAYLVDKDVHPDQPLPDPDPSRSSNMFLNSMVCWSRLAADAWDGLFAAAVAKRAANAENALILDAQIKHWTEVVLPTIPLLPSDRPPDARQLRQHALVHIRLNNLRLLLSRQSLLSLKYDGERGRLCGDLALDILHHVQAHSSEVSQPSSFRFSMATSLGSCLLVFSALLSRDLSAIGLQDSWSVYVDGFRQAHSILHDLASHLSLAQRILDNFRTVMSHISPVLNRQQQGQEFPQTLVPPFLDRLFPYRSFDFAQQLLSLNVLQIRVSEAPVNGTDDMIADGWGFEEGRKSSYDFLWI